MTEIDGPGRVGGGRYGVSIAVGLALGLLACDDGPPPAPPMPPPAEWTAEARREAEALVAALSSSGAGEPAAVDSAGSPVAGLQVRLAFGAGADLDLYVTGPLEETVYHANSPSAIGGELVADRRCVHPAPRIETVRFAAPVVAGRYRVGIDYAHACGESEAPAPYAVAIEAPGTRHALRGLARHRVFEPVVFELDLADTASPGEDREERQ